MFFIPRFLKPKKNIVKILRIHTGIYKKVNVKRLFKSVDVYNEPLQLVFLLATAIQKIDKNKLPKQLTGVISHEYFGNAMTMAAFQKICKLYNKHNIPVLPQKGLVHKLLMPEIIRPMNDADFAVPKTVYRDAIKIATDNGFHINHDMLFSADLQMGNMGCVDVHYAIFKGSNPDMDDAIFWRAKPTSFDGLSVLMPTPEDRLIIIMCEFYGNFLFEAGSRDTDIKKIFATHPLWVLDAYDIIKKHSLNWGQLMRTAQMSGYSYQIKILTRLLNKILPGTVSGHACKVIDSMCPDSVVNKYLKRDKKIVQIHSKNHKRYIKEDL